MQTAHAVAADRQHVLFHLLADLGPVAVEVVLLFDQFAALLRWIRGSFRLLISVARFYFPRPRRRSICRASNGGARSCSRSATCQSQPAFANHSRRHSGRRIHTSAIAKAVRSCDCRAMHFCHPCCDEGRVTEPLTGPMSDCIIGRGHQTGHPCRPAVQWPVS